MTHDDKEDLAVIINSGFQNLTDTMNQRFAGVDTRLDKVENRLEKVETRLDGVETRLDGVETRLDGVETELSSLSQKITQIDLRTQNQIDEQYERTHKLEKRTTVIEEHIGLKPVAT